MSILNAITAGAGGVALSGDTTGNLTIQSAGTNVVTFTSTGMVSNVGAPAFSATADGTQSLANNTYTKILFVNEAFDTNNNFASSTFTPTVAGYYYLTSYINSQNALGSNESLVVIRKNGSNILVGTDMLANHYGKGVSGLVYANGSTDYFEIYLYQGSGGAVTNNTTSIFSGFLARSA